MGAATSKKRKLVLIVEDDALLRMDAMQMIDEAGFDVLEAANADAAISILEARSDIDVIFTDIDMPDGSMNGLKLAHAVKGRWPPIKIITTSGHFNVRHDDLPSGGEFIPKPYSFTEVTRTIHHLLGSSP
jgi:two-component system, response regulator PdtaR